MFWRRKKITQDIKSVAEVAGDQIAPGVGTYAIVLSGLAVAAAGAYVIHQKRKNKKAAAKSATASSGTDKPD